MTARMNDMMKPEQFIKRINDLPILPDIFYRISDMLENPRVSTTEVTGEIAKDPAIASKVLKMVNSSFYGLPNKVSSLTRAVVLLGFNTLKSLVLATSVADMFAGGVDTGLNLHKLWEHSFACGLISRNIARKMFVRQNEEYFIAGLLHDIGKILLNRYASTKYMEAMDYVAEKNCLLVDAEKHVFGFTHSEIGAHMATKWNLPPKLTNSIRYHHSIEETEKNTEFVLVIKLADILCRALEIGSGGDDKIPEITVEQFSTLELTYERLFEVMQESVRTETDEPVLTGEGDHEKQ